MDKDDEMADLIKALGTWVDTRAAARTAPPEAVVAMERTVTAAEQSLEIAFRKVFGSTQAGTLARVPTLRRSSSDTTMPAARTDMLPEHVPITPPPPTELSNDTILATVPALFPGAAPLPPAPTDESANDFLKRAGDAREQALLEAVKENLERARRAEAALELLRTDPRLRPKQMTKEWEERALAAFGPHRHTLPIDDSTPVEDNTLPSSRSSHEYSDVELAEHVGPKLPSLSDSACPVCASRPSGDIAVCTVCGRHLGVPSLEAP